ncbi:hypothetical protein IPJ72_03425 [Candidatus Peregrinibacteria bacterium]|nr:MAG: hypothetical protein IPJ72_03425 [Candidatus Peregrinibacteria bacterium]
MQNTETAFHWIIDLLEKNNIQFRISGGFAARLYGSNRPLYDIDIEIKDRDFDRLMPLVKEKIIYGPARYQDEVFDLFLATLEFEGQEIDLCGCETTRLFNHQTGEWERTPSILMRSPLKKFTAKKFPSYRGKI